jgi:septal ring-binding cell division protein DamX
MATTAASASAASAASAAATAAAAAAAAATITTAFPYRVLVVGEKGSCSAAHGHVVSDQHLLFLLQLAGQGRADFGKMNPLIGVVEFDKTHSVVQVAIVRYLFSLTHNLGRVKLTVFPVSRMDEFATLWGKRGRRWW